MKTQTTVKPTQEEKALATELMIGNFVKVNRFNIDIPATIENFDDLHQISNGYLKVKGEPLTEDWLLKFGFEKTIVPMKSDIEYIDYRMGQFVLFILPKGIVEVEFYASHNKIEERGYLRSVQFVHQLQNLYCCLTGLKLRQKGGEGE